MIFRLVVALTTAVGLFAGLSPARAAVDSTLPNSADATSPVIALDPSGDAYVVARAADGSTSFWKVAESGATALVPGGLFSNLEGGAPGGLAVDTAGYPHVAERAMGRSIVRRSIDGGQTWDRGTAIAAPGKIRSLASTNFNSIVEGSTLYALGVFRDNVVLSTSENGGLAFQGQDLLVQGCETCTETLSNMAVTPDGEIWVAYSDEQGWGMHMWSADGSTIGSHRILPSVDLVEPSTLAVDSEGDVYATLAYADSGLAIDKLHDFGGPLVTTAQVVTARVAAGDGSVGVSWIQTDEDGVDRLYFRSGPDLRSLGEPIVVGPVDGTDLALATDSSNVYRLIYRTAEGLRFITVE
jgi:hypothetical protein